MIFYFSGTGNSQSVALALGEMRNETPVSIAGELQKAEQTYTYWLNETESVYFVFPVHSWGPAVAMMQFVRRVRFDNYRQQPVYGICVCGDDCGQSDRLLAEALQPNGYILTACFSVTMPNNYILLPGFDVDSPEQAARKLAGMQSRLSAIESVTESLADVQNQSAIGCSSVTDPETRQKHLAVSAGLYVSGSFPWIKTRGIYPLFVKYALKKQAFRTTESCNGCGKCARICPVQTISMVNKKPVWGKDCVQCLACIHRCPVRGIEYGKATERKGRYHHPDLK